MTFDCLQSRSNRSFMSHNKILLHHIVIRYSHVRRHASTTVDTTKICFHVQALVVFAPTNKQASKMDAV